MNRFTQNLIFGFTSVLFVGLLTWALLSANGIRLQPISPNTDISPIVAQGAIRINNDQFNNFRDVTAFLNNEEVDIREKVIENVFPGNYSLRLEIENFRTWNGEITVNSAVITDVNPFFFPDTLPLNAELSSINIDDAFFSEYGDYVYYVSSKSDKGTENGIFRYQLTDSSTIFRSEESVPEKIANISGLEEILADELFEIIPSPDNRKIILQSKAFPKYILDTQTSEKTLELDELESIESLVGFLPDEYDWFKGSSAFIYKHENLVAEFLIDSKTTTLISYTPETDPIYGVNGDIVVYYDAFNQELVNYQNNLKRVLEFENIAIPSNISQIWVNRNDASFLVLKSGDKFYFLDINNSFVKEFGEKIEIIDFAKDGKSVLFKLDNKFKTFNYFENIGLNEIETTESTISSTDDVLEIGFSTLSNHIVRKVDKKEEGFEIILTDKKGSNEVILVEGKSVNPLKNYITNDNKRIFLLLKESLDTETDITRNTLFSIILDS